MSTWDAMSESEYADCIDAGRGPVRDVRDEADQLRKAARENGSGRCPVCGTMNVWDAMRQSYRCAPLMCGLQTPVFSGAGLCILCQQPTVGSVHGEPVCGECEERMAAETRETP